MPSRLFRYSFGYNNLVVGTFHKGGYPTSRGIYPYTPFRPGHTSLRRVLKDGKRAVCSFRSKGRDVLFEVAQAERHGSDGWLLEITRMNLEDADRRKTSRKKTKTVK